MDQQLQPVQLGVAIEHGLYRQLRIRAAVENTTMRSVLERALRAHLSQQDGKTSTNVVVDPAA